MADLEDGGARFVEGQEGDYDGAKEAPDDANPDPEAEVGEGEGGACVHVCGDLMVESDRLLPTTKRSLRGGDAFDPEPEAFARSGRAFASGGRSVRLSIQTYPRGGRAPATAPASAR